MDQFHPRPANSSPLTPLTFLDRCATVYGDCPSVVYGNTTYTWTETRQRCLRVASSISKLGIKRLEVVSVIAPNVPAMYELYFAIPFAGAVINSINTRLDARTVSVILAHSESKLVFVDYDSVSIVGNALSMFPPNKPKPMLVLVIDDGVKIQDSTGFECTYESMVENGDPNFNWIRPVSEWDPITLNYTSGTTSSPKGVVHCHRGMFAIAVDSLIECVEVESILYTHPAVNEAAVVARADEFWGETPCAFVSLKAEMAGKVTEKEVVDYCKGKLPGYMVPKTVVFKEELPKTSTGKIQKFVLREMAKKMGTIRKSRM
ncbi:putative AMP-dependent synthetase/ligase, AMP-binding, AMP-binding enzyme domain-containing protein [Helianthus debilis subsp. tardiflorus]